MTNRYLLITLIISLTSVLMSTYRVVNEENHPLETVFVVAGEKVFITDENGYFSLPTEYQIETIKLYRTGYRQLTVSLSDIGENRLIVMKKEVIDIEPLTVRGERDNIGDRTIIKVNPQMSQQTLPDLLNRYLDVGGAPLSGERQTISVGGHHSRHLIIMLDGVPLNKMGQPVDVSSIPLGKIESIEIIRGGASVEGGAGAIAGLINLRTKDWGEQSEYSVTQSVGSFRLNRTSLSLSRTINRLWLDIFGERSYARNDFPYKDRTGKTVTRELNDKESYNLYLKTVYRHTNTLLVHKIDYETFNNKMPGPINYPQLYYDARLQGSGLSNNIRVLGNYGDYQVEGIVYHKYDKTDYDNTRTPQPFFKMKGQHRDEKRGVHFKGAREFLIPPSGSDKNDIFNYNKFPFDKEDILINTEISAEYNREEFQYNEPTNPANSISPVIGENYALKTAVNIINPLFTGKRMAGYWNNNGSLRYDHTNLWGNNYSGRYVTSYNMHYPDILIGYSISSNYALPSFYDLYWKGDCQASGNPDLLPEESVNKRLFSEYKAYEVSFAASYEYSNIDNLIHWYRSVTGWKPGNISSARIANLNLNLSWQPYDTSLLTFSYSYTDAENRTLKSDGSKGDFYGKKLPYKPRDNFSAELYKTINLYQKNSNRSSIPTISRTRINQLTFTIFHSYTGEQWTTLDQLIDPLPAYHITDFDISMNAVLSGINCLFSVSLNNIFNTHYEIYPYTPQPGFNWMLRVTISR